MKRLLTLFLMLLMVVSLTGCDEELDEEITSNVESPTNTRASEEEDAKTATVMVYMVASDLESKSGCASADIEEMVKATLSDNVHVVLETGGSTYWTNENMTASKVERFEVTSDGVNKVDTVGKCKEISMADPDTLSDFLSWGMENYPADRYGVILWNHGGGSMMGYGYDEYHTDDLMGIDEIGQAFKKADAKVDFVGFDACLMGTIETAYVLSDYADYMIASEETEPGSGWFYTNWLTALAENPGISMKDLAKTAINDFVDGEDSSFWDDYTLALYDLQDCKETYAQLCSYLKESKDALRKDGFSQMASARNSVRSYGDGEYEQIDILSYLDKAGLDDEELKSDLEDMIVYYNGNISNSTGMAMYYPYSYLKYYSQMSTLMKSIGMDESSHIGFFNDFTSILVNGQIKEETEETAADTSPIGQLTGEETDVSQETTSAEDYTEEDWYDDEVAGDCYDDAAALSVDEELIFKEEGDHLVLDLTDDQWNSISKVEMELYLKDEYGYAYFGNDSLVSFNEDGDLLGDYDYTWVTINGQFVPFYILSDTEDGDQWQATGYVPAILNADTNNELDIDIYIRWDNEHEDGYVMGYTTYKNDEDTLTVANKTYLSFAAGDTLDFYCDYYTEDGEYDDSYFIGDTLKIKDPDLTVSYEELDEDQEVEICFKLTDMYQNTYWTEVLEG